MSQTIPPPTPPRPSRVGVIAAVAIGLVLIGPFGYYVGRQSQQDAIDDRDKQLQVCGDVAGSLQGMLGTMLQAFEAYPDTDKMAAAQQAQQAESAALRSKYGTDHVPTIIDKCTGGQ